eukprot:CAMPEP_0170550166 /NCGR_PEP_ID=MMETSP0211-20121228/8236_1 /TAXON_ID=311385 /ORGANISM="Pseudokeronopsis sp., Strain OXSARD2" /LENGTH=65 /DNA_ID=CAMNT_0010856555 /DNA_START=452 /DNA_END=649 /DNA_ORIENTATION=-
MKDLCFLKSIIQRNRDSSVENKTALKFTKEKGVDKEKAMKMWKIRFGGTQKISDLLKKKKDSAND